jgi:hypothetical protein
MCVFVDRKDEEVWFVVCCNSKANDVRTAYTYGTLCSKRVAKLVREAHRCPFTRDGSYPVDTQLSRLFKTSCDFVDEQRLVCRTSVLCSYFLFRLSFPCSRVFSFPISYGFGKWHSKKSLP